MDMDEYSKRFHFHTEYVPPLLLEYLGRTDWKSYLDLGCGDGAFLYGLESKGLLAGKTVYAVDLSPSRLELVQAINGQFVCLQDDVCDTQVQDSSIDFLTTTQVIEHVPDDGDMVKEIHRVLAPNGTLYLSTVFKRWYGWYFYRCNGRWTLDPTHLREYTSDEQLLGILQQWDLEILENRKSLDGRPITDAILRRIGAGRRAYDNSILKRLRGLTVPIPGYYIWEIICRKRSAKSQIEA